MVAGREMDALIAEKVMGWARVGENWHTKPQHRPSLDRPGETYDEWDAKGPHDFLIPPDAGIHHRKGVSFCGCEYDGEIPPYSTSIESAWQVVEKMKQGGGEVQIHTDLCGTNVALIEGEECLADVTDKSAPLAICLAALIASGVEVA